MTATTEVEAGEGREARTSTIAAATRLLAAAAGVLPCCAQGCDALEAEVVPSDAVGRALGGRGRVPAPRMAELGEVLANTATLFFVFLSFS